VKESKAKRAKRKRQVWREIRLPVSSFHSAGGVITNVVALQAEEEAHEAEAAARELGLKRGKDSNDEVCNCHGRCAGCC
jgi:hypothetical protein